MFTVGRVYNTSGRASERPVFSGKEAVVRLAYRAWGTKGREGPGAENPSGDTWAMWRETGFHVAGETCQAGIQCIAA